MFTFILILLALGCAFMYDGNDNPESEVGALFLSILTILIIGGLLGAAFVTIN